MRQKLAIRFICCALMAAITSVAGATSSDQEAKIEEVMEVLQRFSSIPEQAIPPKLLQDAEGIAIIPSVVKIGVVIGGRYGKGVLLLRGADKQFSRPLFMTLKGGSVGWQIGARAIDILLVFKHRRELDILMQGGINLGGDISIAAGPVGEAASAASDTQLSADVYSYSHSGGMFVGFALDEASLKIDEQDNSGYYGQEMISPQQVMTGEGVDAPPSATELIKATDEFIKGSSSE
jgi:lipid-binding SYLF domain-containing protein